MVNALLLAPYETLANTTPALLSISNLMNGNPTAFQVFPGGTDFMR